MVPLRRRPPLPAPSPGGSLLHFALTGARAALAPPLRPHQLSPPKPTPAPPPPPGCSVRPVPPASLLRSFPASLSVYFQRRKRRGSAKMAAGGRAGRWRPRPPLSAPRPRRPGARDGASSACRRLCAAPRWGRLCLGQGGSGEG